MKKMNCWIALSFLAMGLASCSSKGKGGFELKGKLSNSSGETLILEQMTPSKITVIDSAKVDEQGNFVFENTRIPEMDFYRLKISPANFAILVMDSTQKITVNADAKLLAKSYKVEGSEDTKQFIELNALLEKTYTNFDSLKRVYSALMAGMKMDSLKMDSLNVVMEAEYMKIMDNGAPALVKKVEEFPGTIANFSAFDFIDIERNMSTYEKALAALSEKHANSHYTQMLRTNIDAFKKQFSQQASQDNVLPVGGPMPEIKLNNPEGTPVALSSFKGKVVLVDFWASWCGPCRKENPNVVRLYNKFHSKGFDVYGISLDDEKDKWLNAIAKDGLPWTHVSDLGGWKSSVCASFNITAIPFTVLVDKSGNIVAKGLRGMALEEKVAELIGK